MIKVNGPEPIEFETTAAGLFAACTHAAEEIGGLLDRVVECEGRYLTDSAVISVYDGGEEVAEAILSQLRVAQSPRA